MSGYVQNITKTGNESAPAWLNSIHQSGLENCQSKSIPNRKDENWKYTNLYKIAEDSYQEVVRDVVINEQYRGHYRIEGLKSVALVFVNGIYSEELSDPVTLSGLNLVRFQDADDSDIKSIKQSLGTVARREKSVFTAINDQGVADGVFLQIEEDTKLETPVQIVSLTTPHSRSHTVFHRLLVVMEANSEATLLESFVSDQENQNSLTNSITEIILRQKASLQHFRIHTEHGTSLHIGGDYFELHEQSKLESFHLATGSDLKRIDVTVNHVGEGADCQLYGAYLLGARQHVDYHTTIEHKVPRCTTSENFRGIVGDAAKAVFNGRIHIHADAQKTKALLSNRNLLTSIKAEVDTKPELEIYADDVECAHGATVSQLDEASLHYMKTRGINHDEAIVMLSFGFINELLTSIGNLSIANHLRPLLISFLARKWPGS